MVRSVFIILVLARRLVWVIFDSASCLTPFHSNGGWTMLLLSSIYVQLLRPAHDIDISFLLFVTSVASWKYD